MKRALGATALALAFAACASLTVRRPNTAEHEAPAGVVHMVWRTPLHEHGLFEPRSEECATGVVVGSRVITGSRAGRVVALDAGNGRVLWSTAVSGSVDSEARFDSAHGQVYVGTDDGSFYAFDPGNGAIKWSYKGKGAIERAPEIGPETLYVSTARDHVFSLDARTGKHLWQYDRDTPEGFTIHGHAGPRLHDGIVYAGFSDGFLVALGADGGDVLWARSLAAASEQFVDVDSTPVFYRDMVIASSYSGGLYALSGKNGEPRWRLGVEGVGTVTVADERFYFAAPRDGLAALTTSGQILWRQGLADAGDLTPPVMAGSLLLYTGARAGLFAVARESGKLLQLFDPGHGMCGGVALDPSGANAFVLANSGSLYALALSSQP